MATIQFLTIILFLAFFQRIGIAQNKPPMNKYEIALFGLIIGLAASSTLLVELRFLNFYGYMLLIFAAIALMLITIAYHVDRKAQWKKNNQHYNTLRSKISFEMVIKYNLAHSGGPSQRKQPL